MSQQNKEPRLHSADYNESDITREESCESCVERAMYTPTLALKYIDYKDMVR